jgi:hypothetical protein
VVMGAFMGIDLCSAEKEDYQKYSHGAIGAASQ